MAGDVPGVSQSGRAPTRYQLSDMRAVAGRTVRQNVLDRGGVGA